MSKNNVICYDGIQRIYRNAVVRFLRSSFTASFGNEAIDKVRTPFPAEEWTTIQRHASASRISGQLDAKLVDDFDLLGVNHFFNVFDKYFDLLLPTASNGLDNKEKGRQKSKLLIWLKTIKELRDPLSHPGEHDFTREDSFTLLDCARRVLLRLNLETDANEIKLLMDSLFFDKTQLPVKREPLEDQLPPRESIVVDFIGRDHELKELQEWFEDPVSRRWALSGEGGKGKSALAFNFAFDVKVRAPQPFQTVLWLSAKRRRFLEGTTIIIGEPDFSDLDSALSYLLAHYGWVDEMTSPVETKRTLVLELLDKFPALVVVDDVDSLESDEEDAIEFFSLHFPQTKSKVLFTSRRTIFGMGSTTTDVKGFRPDDAAKFIFSRCELMNLDKEIFEPSIIQEIIRVTDSSPLYIEDLMRLIAVVPAKQAIKQWESKGGNEARRYALGRECDGLTEVARRALIGACVCPGAVSFVELEAIAECSTKMLTESLKELQRLFLIPKPRLIEGEQRFEVNVNTRALVREVYGSSEQYRRMEAAYRVINEGASKTVSGDIEAILRQAVFLTKARRLEEAEQLLSTALEKYHSNSEIIAFLGQVYAGSQPPRLTDARETFKRAWQLKHSQPEMYESWVRMELGQREWSKAIEAAEKGLDKKFNSKALLYLAGKASSEMGKELLGKLFYDRANKHLSEAKRSLKSALEISKGLTAQQRALDSEIYKELISICELSKDVQNIEYYLWRWRSENPDDPVADSEWSRISTKYSYVVA